MSHQRIAWAALAGLALLSGRAWAQDATPRNCGAAFKPDLDPTMVCDPDDPTHTVNKDRVAMFYYWQARQAGCFANFRGDLANNPRAFFSDKSNVSSHCFGDPKKCADDFDNVTASIGSYLTTLGTPHGPSTSDITGQLPAYQKSLFAFMADPGDSHLRCKPPAGAATPSAAAATSPTLATITNGLQYFRLRGNADELGASHLQTRTTINGADATNSYQPYYANQGAKLSVGVTGTTHSQADNVVGAVGLPFHLGWDNPAYGPDTGLWFTPYVGFDREATFRKSTKPSTTSPYSADFLDYGSIFEKFFDTAGTVLLRPDYLENFLDNSRLATANLRFVPLIADSGPPLPLNHYLRLSDQFNYMLRLDLRGMYGDYVAVGTPADKRINHDYVRLGGSVGPAVELNLLPSNPIEISTTYTDFYAASGFRKDLGNYQAAVSLKFGPSNAAAITASYINGRREDTAARIDQATIGLTLQY